MKIKEWWQQTHGASFELLRHFLSTFFDNDLITTPGQITPALIGAFTLFLPWFEILFAPLREKYVYLSSLPNPQPYQAAVRADELWLITLMMSLIGLLTAIKWQSIFPDLRDYRSLASLPLRSYHIVSAKLLALLLVTTAAIATLNFLPSLLFPMVAASRWSINPSPVAHSLAHAVACIASSFFFFFAFVALQGILLVILRPGLFRTVTGYLQGFLVTSMLVVIVMSFSIQPRVTERVLHPALAHWLPPVWFLGLYQFMRGDADPQMRTLASRALIALSVSVVLTITTYVFSYQHHREGVLEMAPRVTSRRRLSAVLDFCVPQPRQAAIVSFIVKTLAGSPQHRTILLGYLGFGMAIALSGLLGLREVVPHRRLIAATFVYGHLVVVIFLLIGFRHLFSIPTELRANWLFRITEEEGRREWLAAVDHLLLLVATTGLFLVPFPLEFKLLGWRAVPESLLLAAFGLLCFEWTFYSWEKVPFTCSHLPGKFPIWIRALQLLGLITLLAPANALLVACLYVPLLWFVLLAIMLVAWYLIHHNRSRGRGETRLKFEELPEPVVLSLSLLK